MVGDAAEDVAQIGFRIDAVHLRRLDQRHDPGGAVAAGVRACEQPDDMTVFRERRARSSSSTTRQGERR